MPAKKPVNTGKTKKPEKKDSGISTARFPVVGLGASAGGLAALKSFFSEVPQKSGMAYIVAVHLASDQPSMMPELLQSKTAIPVQAARNNQVIKPDNVYVMPPDREIQIKNGRIRLNKPGGKTPHLPIDLLLRSLADDQGNMAIAVILSGTGTDGTLGIQQIKGKEGLVLAQDEESAGYDGMPRSAASTGQVDMVVPPGEMPGKIMQYFRHFGITVAEGSTVQDDRAEQLHKIYAILKTHRGHDFSMYKVSTLSRRIARRMGLNHINRYSTYVKFLREHPGEIDALFHELLIGVTSFFRDNESFEVLKNTVLPDALKGMKNDETFRIWVPGCSTGEEVYSLAIILRECLETTAKKINVQIFGTDIDNRAIEKARDGLYPSTIAADVGMERLKRFFTREGEFYRIKKEIRDWVVFSVQDVIKDPPFSHLNMLCCRNLLIYLDTEAQKKLLPLFHYTLKGNGILVLGSSETIGGFSTLFETLDKKWRIFKKRDLPRKVRQVIDFPSGTARKETYPEAVSRNGPDLKANDIGALVQLAILDEFAPTSILVDSKGNILHVQGRTGKYLETPSGPPTHNILDLAREGLRIELASALRMAASSSEKITRQRITVGINGDTHMIDLHICPLNHPHEIAGFYLIAIEDVDPDRFINGPVGGDGKTQETPAKIIELERELQITRESHQTALEELESSNEELKSTNEEMQSSNEELQSTNEELESSKEELQSLNEELQTVNAELQTKLEELSAVHDDMRNLLNSTEIATIFVDNEIRVRRFTPQAVEIVNLIQTDIGRPLQHVVNNLRYEHLTEDLKRVIKKLITKELEVETSDGNWFSMRIIPYRTTDNRIDGAVITFTSISDQKKTQKELEEILSESEISKNLVRSIFDMNVNPLAVLDRDGRMIIANSEFTSIFKIDQKDLGAADLFKKGILPASVRRGLDTALKKDTDLSYTGLKLATSQGKMIFNLTGRIIKARENMPYRILLNFEPGK